MTRHHVIISGTGRAGTTFLVQLLTELRLDTGFDSPKAAIFENCNAGMEQDIRLPGAPYIVKDPWLCERLDEILTEQDLVIDHAFVPVRDLYAAAESRRDVMRRNPELIPLGDVPGGLWLTSDPGMQESVLTVRLYRLIYTLAKRSIPVTFLHFPRLVQDPDYLFTRLQPLLQGPGVDRAAFAQAFERVARPELVHAFAPPQPGQAE